MSLLFSRWKEVDSSPEVGELELGLGLPHGVTILSSLSQGCPCSLSFVKVICPGETELSGQPGMPDRRWHDSLRAMACFLGSCSQAHLNGDPLGLRRVDSLFLVGQNGPLPMPTFGASPPVLTACLFCKHP